MDSLCPSYDSDSKRSRRDSLSGEWQRGLVCSRDGESWAESTFSWGVFILEYKRRNNALFQWLDFDTQGLTDFLDLGTKIALRFDMPDGVATMCYEERNTTALIYDDLHYVYLNSTQVLTYNRVKPSSKRRDLLSLAPEACNRL